MSYHSSNEFKTVDYQITWDKPFAPNGLIYFYTVHLDQQRQNVPKDERCVGHDVHSVEIPLLPRTTYHLTIVTYTVARLNHEYDGQPRLFSDEGYPGNATNFFYQLTFTTIDLPGKYFNENQLRTTFSYMEFSFSSRINTTKSMDYASFCYWFDCSSRWHFVRCTDLLLQIQSSRFESIDFKKSKLW